MKVANYGIAVAVPAGWDVRIFRRTPEAGATANPVVHAATFPLPAQRGDFGSGAVERMGGDDVLVVLFEYDPAASRTALFSPRGRPSPAPADFNPRGLQRTLRGQSGRQYFYTEQGRAFCLYIVLGSHARRAVLVPRARQLLAGVAIAPVSATVSG